MTTEYHAEAARKSGFSDGEKPLNSLGISSESQGQAYPKHYPHHSADKDRLAGSDDALGEPLSIRQVARMLGCSPWTVRHSYLPRGLPHLRSRPLGKLIFYRAQVVRWILERQKKGGM